jgi:hypothetical protein
MTRPRFPKTLLILGTLCCITSFLHCSDSEIPPFPSRIQIVSGDNQFSKFGTELPEPMVVKVATDDGSPAGDITVVFQAILGGGSVSRSRANTNDEGLASTKLTLGLPEGPNSVRAFIDGMSDKNVIFNATASYAYCPEAETTLTVSYGISGHLIFATTSSGLFENHSGLVKVNPFSGGEATAFLGFPTPTGSFSTAIWDVAFSPQGDLYIAATELFDDVIKVAPDGTTSIFTSLGEFYGSFTAAEITYYADGLLAGCNNMGPFIVACQDSVLRFPEVGAVYDGGVNNDAVAADPVTDDIYFIHNSQETLLRLPIDTLTATGPPEIVATLTTDEAIGARGMVCDSDRMIYILIDTDNTKKIMKVSALDGTKELVFDFFTRGTGSEEDAGIQRDLALDPNFNFLYTVDTFNNVFLLYELPSGPLTVTIQDSTISTTTEGGERVGIDVMK